MQKENIMNMLKAINGMKERELRALSKEEVELIINSYGGCNRLQRNKLIEEGKRGIDNVYTLYKTYSDYMENMSDSQYSYLISSILETEKKLIKEKKTLDHTNYPEDSAIRYLDWRRMQLLYIKDLYGIPIDKESTFIKNNQDFYNDLFIKKDNPKEKAL